MSFLDMDERLIELAEKMDLVYSPIAAVSYTHLTLPTILRV